jgi:hypothetical protein
MMYQNYTNLRKFAFQLTPSSILLSDADLPTPQVSISHLPHRRALGFTAL